jgi:hypothetical protein
VGIGVTGFVSAWSVHPATRRRKTAEIITHTGSTFMNGN